MSAKLEQLKQELEGSDEVCASCGIAAIDDIIITLKCCDGGCDLVKYCSDNCQENHKDQQNNECKKRKAEMHDKKLFTQPDSSHLGECSICCLPLPIDASKSTLMTCCCKVICNGCRYANKKREKEAGLKERCPFCRHPSAKSQEEVDKNIMKRIKKNDPVAMRHKGKRHCREKDYDKALQYYAKAAELGDADAHACLGYLYNNGLGVEMDEEKAVYHFEQAAIGGHHIARQNLAVHEEINGRFNRAANHLIIAANLGCDIALQEVKALFVKGIVSKEDYAAALRGYQAAINETKSSERDEGEAYYKAQEASRRKQVK